MSIAISWRKTNKRTGTHDVPDPESDGSVQLVKIIPHARTGGGDNGKTQGDGPNQHRREILEPYVFFRPADEGNVRGKLNQK